MKAPPYRTLVVDDHEAFRRLVCLTLRERTQCEIIGEVCDGLEAVHKAETLQPDLVLLDLGLPGLNGFEVARQIRKLCPAAKILMVSQNPSPDVVAGALRIGIGGYLLKSDAVNLPDAVDSVLRGIPFLSSQLNGKPQHPADSEPANNS